MFSYSECFLNKFQCVGLLLFFLFMFRCWIILLLVFSVSWEEDTRHRIIKSNYPVFFWKLEKLLFAWLPECYLCVTNILVLLEGCQNLCRLYRHEKPLWAQDFCVSHKNKGLRSRADTSWVVTDHMKFNKSKCQVLCLGWDNPGSLYKLEDRKLEGSLQKETWEVGLMASWTWVNSLAAKRATFALGCIKNSSGGCSRRVIVPLYSARVPVCSFRCLKDIKRSNY